MVVAGIGGSIVQNSPRAVLDRVQPKLSRISLIGGWNRLFGAQGLAEFLKSVAKLLLTIAFLVGTMRGVHTTLLEGMLSDPESFGLVLREILIRLLVTVTLVWELVGQPPTPDARDLWLGIASCVPARSPQRTAGASSRGSVACTRSTAPPRKPAHRARAQRARRPRAARCRGRRCRASKRR